MKYQNRIILFLDLLGFRNTVEKTDTDFDLLESIYKLLSSITEDSIAGEVFNALNREIIPRKVPQKFEEALTSIDEIVEHFRLLSTEATANSSLMVTHFSDSLVISATSDDEEAIVALIELIAKLNYRLWDDYRILTRGGITVGKLFHEKGSVLFGPAMLRAYDIESKEAIFPRVLIDPQAMQFIKLLQKYKTVADLFKFAKIDDSLSTAEINLVTSYIHLQNGPYGGLPTIMDAYERSLRNALPRLMKIQADIKEEAVIRKYLYIIEEMQNYVKDYNFWDRKLQTRVKLDLRALSFKD